MDSHDTIIRLKREIKELRGALHSETVSVNISQINAPSSNGRYDYDYDQANEQVGTINSFIDTKKLYKQITILKKSNQQLR